MSYIVVYLLIAVGYVIGAPILEESLQYRLIKCIPIENETLSLNILELYNINETCIKVNKSSSYGDELYLYIIPENDTSIQIQITADDCSSPLANIYLTLCNNEIDYNYTEVMITYTYSNINSTHKIDDNENISTSQSIVSIDSTNPTVYETLHYINHDSDQDENNTTDRPTSYIDNKYHQTDILYEDID